MDCISQINPSQFQLAVRAGGDGGYPAYGDACGSSDHVDVDGNALAQVHLRDHDARRYGDGHARGIPSYGHGHADVLHLPGTGCQPASRTDRQRTSSLGSLERVGKKGAFPQKVLCRTEHWCGQPPARAWRG